MSNSIKSPRLSPDERREQIVNVASVHLEQGSYESLSIQAVAVDAGVTRALVHHYFGGKESLFEAVIQRELKRLLEATAPSPELSAAENLDRALGAYLDHFSASSGELRALYSSGSTGLSGRGDLAAQNHAVQVERILSLLTLKDTPATRVGIGSWLAFVVEAATESANRPGAARADVMRLCRATLSAVVDEVAGVAGVASATPHSSTQTQTRSKEEEK